MKVWQDNQSTWQNNLRFLHGGSTATYMYHMISQVSTGSIQMVAVQWTPSEFTVVLRMAAVQRALMLRSGWVLSHKNSPIYELFTSSSLLSNQILWKKFLYWKRPTPLSPPFLENRWDTATIYKSQSRSQTDWLWWSVCGMGTRPPLLLPLGFHYLSSSLWSSS